MKYNKIMIEGNIGVGKTTLTRMLAKHFNTKALLESDLDVKLLEKFYEKEIPSMLVEFEFLIERYKQLTINSGKFISDYSYYRTQVFAECNLDPLELDIFYKYYNTFFKSKFEVDLIIFLHAEVDQLLKNIRNRGIDYEQSIQADYLKLLEKNFDHLISTRTDKKILKIDLNDVDFSSSGYQFNQILDWLKDDYLLGLNHRKFN